MLFSTCASLPSLSSEAQSIVLNHPNRNMATQIRLLLSYLKSDFKTCNWNCKRICFNLFYWDCLEKYCCSASGGFKKIVYVGSMGHSLTTFQHQLLAKLELGTAQPQLVFKKVSTIFIFAKLATIRPNFIILSTTFLQTSLFW